MLAIRLKPIGTKLHRSYRIIVIHKRRSRDSGLILDNLGFYIPTSNLSNNRFLGINCVRLSYWILRGAQIKKSKSHPIVHLTITNFLNNHHSLINK